MAEAPPQGLFWQWMEDAAAVAELEHGVLLVQVSAPGPAGSSSVELPSGEVLEVDHLDPARLIGVEVPGPDPSASPLLLGAFGGDGAMRLVDEVRARTSSGSVDELDPDRASPVAASRRSGRGLDLGAQRAGRLVVLADLATDPAAHPLARVVAAGEFVASLDRTPGGDLFAPLAPGLVARAAAESELVEDVDLGALGPKVAARLDAVLRQLVAAAADEDAAALERLVERFGRTDHLREPPFAKWPAAGAAAAPAELRVAEVASLSSDAAEPLIERIARSVLQVSVPGVDEGRWVRVLHRDRLVAVSTAPLRSEGASSRAELLVPRDLVDEDVVVQVVDVHGLTASGAPTELVRRAVRLGRAAASAERAGRRGFAIRRWRACAELWELVGDWERVRLARRRGASSGSRAMVEPLMADELDPYGSELELERARW